MNNRIRTRYWIIYTNNHRSHISKRRLNSLRMDPCLDKSIGKYCRHMLVSLEVFDMRKLNRNRRKYDFAPIVNMTIPAFKRDLLAKHPVSKESLL